MGQFTISHSDNRDILLLPRHHTAPLVESTTYMDTGRMCRVTEFNVSLVSSNYYETSYGPLTLY